MTSDNALTLIKKMYEFVCKHSGQDEYYISFRDNSLDQKGLSLIGRGDNSRFPRPHYFTADETFIILDEYPDLRWNNYLCNEFIRLESIKLL